MKYKKIFLPGTLLRERFDSICAGKGDPAPGSSNSEDLEKMLEALANKQPNPFERISVDGVKTKKREIGDYPLVRTVSEALLELFSLQPKVSRNLKGFR